ncbi:hypothetical protein [uncultured Piscinibacter sp.]|uniref:hypothetical protein n=1 Tax=uncultured Piscinibacter sp. TaxID=1131835 RepID=UPI00261C7388|nr:hypothetical protein [uncultured Piscinibacter sp.]
MQIPQPRRKTATALSAWWRVAKTMQPGERGAIRLMRQYGDQLVCVRYRQSGTGEERLTTVELIIERTVIRKRCDEIVSFKIKDSESALRREALRRGARFDSKTRLWRLPRHEVLSLGLRHRIALPVEQLLREEESIGRNAFLDMAK